MSKVLGMEFYVTSGNGFEVRYFGVQANDDNDGHQKLADVVNNLNPNDVVGHLKKGLAIKYPLAAGQGALYLSYIALTPSAASKIITYAYDQVPPRVMLNQGSDLNECQCDITKLMISGCGCGGK